SKDRLVLGEGLPRIAETFLASGPKGLQIAQVLNGDGGEEAFWLRQPGGRWQPLSGFQDGVKGLQAAADGWLYLLSTKGAPKGQVLRLKLGQPLAKAEVLVPEAEGTLTQFKLLDGQLYLSYLLGGPSELRRVDLKTRKSEVLPLPAIASVDALVKGDKGELLASVQSYTQPQAWYRVHKDGHLEVTALAQKSNVDFSDVEVLREFATSKDGTRVPLNILRPKGLKLDGSHPVLLYGYGGYSVSQTPGFNALRKVWLERGGVMVIANLRGGGEFGEAWHLAGNLTRKQNVFDDFIGAAEHLIARGYTRPERLAIQGGSNGGLLMGAALTQRPELFRAVHASVGIYDMLRVELDANGAFNITEFGTVKDEAQFRALLGYSPLHKVKDGTRYPAVLFTTGDHDGRVNPMQSRKMVARLQAAQSASMAERPILLRTSANAGHGMGSSTSEVIAERTDSYSFLMDQLGMPLQKP
ncbi:MAG TPA: prolyl oligopeptidase family serine peptidase, partial [Burkholderiaceae bacterium]|nr:prolyl oligopeptidase family serine peptidase [Burkholderiaceae bacterium]